jgi:hypothetical protein
MLSQQIVQTQINIQVRENEMKSVQPVFGAVTGCIWLVLMSACGSSATSASGSNADPLSEFFGSPSPEKIQAIQTTAQKKTAECMRTQGFTYVPYTPPQSQIFSSPKPGERAGLET